MTNYKKFIPCIFLKNEKAVAGFQDSTVVSENPVQLARFYGENNADELLVFDLSTDDDSHERALDLIKEICHEAQIPVIGAGNVKRMEDIKKLLYAGCSRAALNYSKEGNVEITREVSLKFGKDKIVACIAEASEIETNAQLLGEFVEEVILIHEKTIKQAIEVAQLPVIVTLPEVSLDKIIELLSCETIAGVTGPAINENAKEINDIKDLCAGNGVKVRTFEPAIAWAELTKNSDGLVPVVVQDYKTREVLMVAYMNEEAYLHTLKSGRMTYYSRSRKEQWIKGETSGHFQYVKELTADCDKDTILAKVSQVGAACHTGSFSCFENPLWQNEALAEFSLAELYRLLEGRKTERPEGSYTTYLFNKGLDKILKKVGEECTEVIIAGKAEDKKETVYEIADLAYHVMVLMVQMGITVEDVHRELASRHIIDHKVKQEKMTK